EISAPDRKHEDHVFRLQVAHLQPLDENRFPALIIGSRSKLRHVVSWRIGFDTNDLAKIVDGVRTVTRTAPDAEEKQAHAVLTRLRQELGHALDNFDIQAIDDRLYFLQMGTREGHAQN